MVTSETKVVPRGVFFLAAFKSSVFKEVLCRLMFLDGALNYCKPPSTCVWGDFYTLSRPYSCLRRRFFSPDMCLAKPVCRESQTCQLHAGLRAEGCAVIDIGCRTSSVWSGLDTFWSLWFSTQLTGNFLPWNNEIFEVLPVIPTRSTDCQQKACHQSPRRRWGGTCQALATPGPFGTQGGATGCQLLGADAPVLPPRPVPHAAGHRKSQRHI